ALMERDWMRYLGDRDRVSKSCSRRLADAICLPVARATTSSPRLRGRATAPTPMARIYGPQRGCPEQAVGSDVPDGLTGAGATRASVAADVRRRRTLRKSHPACSAQSFRRSRIQLLALPRSSPAAMQWVYANHGPGGTFGRGHGFQAASARCRSAHRPLLAIRERRHHGTSTADRKQAADDEP